MSGRHRGEERRNSRDGPARGRLQLEESRRSFRRQVAQLKDIDDKAMRSVRTAVVVIGFVVTAVGVVSRIGDASLGPGSAFFTGVGVVFLIGTVITGIGTATVTEYRTRLTGSERARLEQPTRSERRNAELVRIYHSWLDVTESELSESAASLGATLASLGFGVFNLSIAAALAVLETTSAFGEFSLVGTLLLNLFTVIFVLAVLGLATKLTIRGVKEFL